MAFITEESTSNYIVSEMVEEYQLRLAPAQAADIEQVKRCVAKERGMDVRTINALRILRRSIDARGRQVVVNLKVRAYINEPAPELAYQPVNYPDVSGARSVIVVGEGPAGLFAAGTRKRRARAEEGSCPCHQGTTSEPREQLLLRRGWRGRVLRRKALYP